MNISVIIPVYNAEKYIKRCLDAVINQTYKDFEIIVVDDGSTDKSFEIVKKLQSEFKKINVLQQEHKGSASARNLALQHVSSKYLCFIDADDFVHQNYLQFLFNIIENDTCDISMCRIKTTDKLDLKLEDVHQPTIKLWHKEKLLKAFCISTHSVNITSLCNKLYKRSLFDDIKFPEDKCYDDEHIIHKIYYRAGKVAIVNEYLYFYYMSENSQMRKEVSLNIVDAFDAVKSQKEFFENSGRKDLSKLILLKYYITLFTTIKKIHESYPDEKLLIKQLSDLTKGWKKSLLVVGPKISDKLYLIKIAREVNF